jgi:hypothetical protein
MHSLRKEQLIKILIFSRSRALFNKFECKQPFKTGWDLAIDGRMLSLENRRNINQSFNNDLLDISLTISNVPYEKSANLFIEEQFLF